MRHLRSPSLARALAFVAIATSTYSPYLLAQSSQPSASQAPASPAAPARASNMLPSGSRLGQPAPMPLAQPSSTPSVPAQTRVESAIEQVAPLNAEEIGQFLRELQIRRLAGQQNISGNPSARAVTTSETIDLTPGASPPLVRVSLGEGVVISFIDSAGRPWPVSENMNFNARAFDHKMLAPHLYSLNIKTNEKANVAVVLKGLDKPVVFTVIPAQTETDYFKEFVIPGFVDGKPPAASALAAAGGAVSMNAPELLNFLYRTIPANTTAKELRVSQSPGTMHAWQISADRMVVRSKSMLVLPGWIRRHASSDGTAVYEVPLSSVVTVSEAGILYRVAISDFSVLPTSTRGASRPQ